jgi:uncharacterized membrane protein YfcA
MVDSLLVILPVATALGVLSGLGTGGGSLLILWLTMAANMAQAEARAMNLLFFLPSAAISCFLRWKGGNLPLKKIWPAILWGCIAAGIFSFVSTQIQTDLLKKLFGILLLFTGLRELLYRPRKPK